MKAMKKEEEKKVMELSIVILECYCGNPTAFKNFLV
ncbi:hypothetical protein ES319_D08G119800v1 [Gossypium barbadense]|uniref:Uncharacterized protein n=2 Tax=Gossypium TaxID=3633 RepID=A0A5J5QD73_GOSBA|nr:hypothetical protein ES319_D08G119800v1 [Gossypium barbadense]TYG57243.1 hypothetical protein ES288_D08G126900v1 [Gossypium darwinii]